MNFVNYKQDFSKNATLKNGTLKKRHLHELSH